MNNKKNNAIRKCARINDTPLYKVAELMGISESQFMKRMRNEWSDEEQSRICRLIEDYARNEGQEED